MTTTDVPHRLLTLSLDRLDEVQPGDRLVAIDDIPLNFKRVFTDGPRRVVPNGPVGIPFEYGGAVTGYLYPDSIVSRSITVEREGAEPEPALVPALVPEPVEVKPAPQPHLPVARWAWQGDADETEH